uniref:Uncharacterized protein n=1 Tax=Clytia hemisphaerica TaxID=252671 RepID=A0A7M5V9Z5_9CNID
MDRQTAKYGALIWDGNIYHEIEDQSGQNYTFHEVDDLIIEDNFKKFEELLEHNPHLINSLRTKRNKTTLLMESAWSRTWAETFPKLAGHSDLLTAMYYLM